MSSARALIAQVDIGDDDTLVTGFEIAGPFREQPQIGDVSLVDEDGRAATTCDIGIEDGPPVAFGLFPGLARELGDREMGREARHGEESALLRGLLLTSSWCFASLR